MIVMGVESSCDETGVGIVRWNGDGTCELLADEVASSVDQHARYGGVVPEVASRAHLEAIVPTMRRALAAAGIEKPDALAVTIGPGLAGALLVGVAAAKAYAAAWNIPFYAVNHLGGHVSVDTLEHGPLPRASHCWSPAVTHTCFTSKIWASPLSNWARLSTTPPVRPSTRWPDCSDSAFPVDRHSMLLRKREIGTQSPSLAA